MWRGCEGLKAWLKTPSYDAQRHVVWREKPLPCLLSLTACRIVCFDAAGCLVECFKRDMHTECGYGRNSLKDIRWGWGTLQEG